MNRARKALALGRSRLGAAWPDLAWCAFVAALPVIYYWRYLGVWGTAWTYPQTDFTEVFWPFETFNVQEWLAGRVPLWNDSIFGGFPHVAALNSAAFSPLGLVNLALYGHGGLETGIYARALVDTCVAAVGMYLLARRLLESRAGAGLAAVVFSLSGFATGYGVNQLDMLEGAAFVPISLFFLDRALTGGRPALNAWLAGWCFAVTILGGYPQMWLFFPLAALALLAYRRWQAGVSPGRIAVSVVVTGAAALSLAAVELAPALEFFANSDRTNAGNATGYVWQQLSGFVLPGADGDKGMFVGLLPVLLLLPAMALRRRRRLLACWLGLATLSLTIALGSNTPLWNPIFSHLGFGLFRGQARFVVVTVLALAIVAGAGLAALTRLLPRGGSILGLALACLAAANLLAANWNNNWPQPGPFVPQIDSAPRIVAAIQAAAQREPLRFDIDNKKESFSPNQAFRHGLQTISGYIDFQIKRVSDVRKTKAFWRQWQLFNVRYIVAQRDLSNDGVQEVKPAADGNLRLFKMLYPLPRAYVVWHAQLAHSPEQALHDTLDDHFDPGQTAVVEEDLPHALAAPAHASQHVGVTLVNPQESRFDVTIPAAGLLVISQAYYPGWKVLVDGQPSTLVRADYALEGVPLDAGHHLVRLYYDPLSFKLGVALSLLSIMGLAIVALRRL